MRPAVRFLAAFRLSLPVAACVAGASPHAFAAADDQYGPSAPMAAPEGFVATARRLVEATVATERAVVSALHEGVSRAAASTWRLNLGTPYAPRGGVTLVRGAAADEASAASPESLDLSLGARWRVVHGDAASHVPAASWMPDLQSADAHLSALRPTMSLSGEWALPNDFSLGVMPGMTVDYSSGRRQSIGTFAVTLGKTWTPQWRTFVDMARDRVAVVQPVGASTSVDAGITFVASRTTQIDFALTRGLSDTAPPFQAGLGVSSTF